MELGETTNDKNKTGRPSSWTPWMDENVKIVPKEINPPYVPSGTFNLEYFRLLNSNFTREAERLKRSSS